MADPYQALYRRYRSKRFSEQRGQDHVMRALRTAVQEDRVGHAYLFSGPRGTGKTSTARILAKVLNCEHPVDGEPCCACDNCRAVDEGRIVDWLLELDAASNNGVANIRELIERIPLGTSGNRKVVILDEVHMLSPGASNALLKSLEEPPSHVVFILATTDPQKVLPTIRSRTQHFEFHLLPADELADHVRKIIADAGLELGEEAVDHVVRQGGGSARDTLSALDQVAAMGGVVVDAEPVDAILQAVQARDAGAALVAVAAATAAGRDPRALGDVLIGRLRQAFLAVMGAPDRHLPPPDVERAEALGTALGPAGLTRALDVLGEALVELAKKPDPRIVLEVALVRLCRPEADRSIDAVLDRLERLERSVASGAAPDEARPAAPNPAPAAAPSKEAGPAGPAAGARAELAKVRGSAPPPGPAGPVRAPVRKATAPAPASTPGPPAAQAPPVATPPTAAASSAASAGGPTLDALTEAWPGVLESCKPSLRAPYEDAQVVGVDERGATLAVPAHMLAACEMKRGDLEAALARQLGHRVAIQLAPDAALGSAGPPSSATAPAAAPEDDDIIDIHELEDAGTAVSGVDRLTEAFPGAELLDEP